MNIWYCVHLHAHIYCYNNSIKYFKIPQNEETYWYYTASFLHYYNILLDTCSGNNILAIRNIVHYTVKITLPFFLYNVFKVNCQFNPVYYFFSSMHKVDLNGKIFFLISNFLNMFDMIAESLSVENLFITVSIEFSISTIVTNYA